MGEELLEETDEDNIGNATGGMSFHNLSCLSYHHGPSLSINRANVFVAMVTVKLKVGALLVL